MDAFVNQCANLIPYDNYSIVTLNNVGSVLMRGDGYFGLIITNTPTLADNTPYQRLDLDYMTCIPLVLFLTKYRSIDLTEVILSSLLINFLDNIGVFFNDYYAANSLLIPDITLIWMNSQIDHTDQMLDTSGGTILYRSEYSWLINPAVQSINPQCC